MPTLASNNCSFVTSVSQIANSDISEMTTINILPESKIDSTTVPMKTSSSLSLISIISSFNSAVPLISTVIDQNESTKRIQLTTDDALPTSEDIVSTSFNFKKNTDTAAAITPLQTDYDDAMHVTSHIETTLRTTTQGMS